MDTGGTAEYDRVRFIGFAIPTTPADMVAVGDPNGTGAVAGTYRAQDNFDADIRTRTRVLEAAVAAARSVIDSADNDGVLNVFVAPEFFWHGPLGPYVYADTAHDPAEKILELLRETFPVEEFPHFLFVFGSVISSQIANLETVLADASTTARNDIVKALGTGWQQSSGAFRDVIFDTFVNFIKNGHAYPQVEVRNRALVLSGPEMSGVAHPLAETAPHTLTTEKYFDSNEDFLLWDVTGKSVITEQMTAYPALDLTAGDFKSLPTDPFAIFSARGASSAINIAVEICLDHADQRIRHGLDTNPWPLRNDGIDLHLLPSCGMQLHPAAVGATAGGWAFNVDGQYALTPHLSEEATRAQRVGGVECSFTDYVDPAAPAVGAHSQLAKITAAAHLGNEHAPGARNAVTSTPTDEPVAVVALVPPADLDACFAGGAGAVHIYGLHFPLPLRTS